MSRGLHSGVRAGFGYNLGSGFDLIFIYGLFRVGRVMRLWHCASNFSHDEQIKEGDQITLLEPWYKSIGFSWKGKVSFFFFLY